MGRYPKEIATAKHKLNPRQAEFADIILAGESQSEAYRQAYNPEATSIESSTGGYKVAHTTAVQEYLKAFREYKWSKSALSRDETLAFLADAVRVKPSDLVDEFGVILPQYAHLIQEVKKTTLTTKNGNEYTTNSIKTVSKMEAARQSAVMQGHNEPVKLSGTLTLQALLPGPDSEQDEQW